MITTELYMTRNDGVKLYITKSDTYTIINESGVEYEDAIDVENSVHTYTETTNYRSDYEGERTMDVITLSSQSLSGRGILPLTISNTPSSVTVWDSNGEMVDVKWTYVNGELRYDVNNTITGCTIKVIP